MRTPQRCSTLGFVVVDGYQTAREAQEEKARELAKQSQAVAAAKHAVVRALSEAVERLRSSGRPPDCMIEVWKKKALFSDKAWVQHAPGRYIGGSFSERTAD